MKKEISDCQALEESNKALKLNPNKIRDIIQENGNLYKIEQLQYLQHGGY